MAQTIELKTRLIHEVGLEQGHEYHVFMSAHDLLNANGRAESYLSWNIPLDANVRRPSENMVTDSILSSLNDGETTIDSPFHISVSSAHRNGDTLTLHFSSIHDGLLDGGHRLLALCIASNQKIDLTKVSVNLVIYAGFDNESLMKKAVALNTSRSVNQMSLANYAGKFDWMKASLENYRIAYYTGQLNGNKITDAACTISRIGLLLLCLDTSYSPYSVDGKKRHPNYVAKTGAAIARTDLDPKIKNLFPLVHDAIDLQTKIFLEVQRRHDPVYGSLFTTASNDARRFTKLPTHDILSCIIKNQKIVFPILSAFRAFVAVENGIPCLPLLPGEKVRNIRKLVNRFVEIAGQERYRGQAITAIAESTHSWDEMCKITYPPMP
ncbi:MAG: hypothetical protein ACKPHV_03850 [Microcystis panniformis]